ncbi:MAG: DNA repair protein RadC [Desulfobacterales bacterium]|uniref:DNA repair protein RadC n=1 Tax=Candidatus Desulfatibia vada TaxID=2841696 RepID=A0A8J6NYB7_9BACT|nr:DNA repair protein RadC [Candidatus Desulfatibia vada]
MNNPSTFWKDLKSGHFVSMVKETSQGQTLSNSREVYNVMKPLFAEKDDVEFVYCIFLNAKNRILAIEKMFSGTISSSAIYPRELIKRIIALKSSAIVIAHNHPSGCTEPSAEDKAITVKTAMALASIDVTLHDHIIVGEGFYSMADAGLLQSVKSRYNDLLSL